MTDKYQWTCAEANCGMCYIREIKTSGRVLIGTNVWRVLSKLTLKRTGHIKKNLLKEAQDENGIFS